MSSNVIFNQMDKIAVIYVTGVTDALGCQCYPCQVANGLAEYNPLLEARANNVAGSGGGTALSAGYYFAKLVGTDSGTGFNIYGVAASYNALPVISGTIPGQTFNFPSNVINEPIALDASSISISSGLFQITVSIGTTVNVNADLSLNSLMYVVFFFSLTQTDPAPESNLYWPILTSNVPQPTGNREFISYSTSTRYYTSVSNVILYPYIQVVTTTGGDNVTSVFINAFNMITPGSFDSTQMTALKIG